MIKIAFKIWAWPVLEVHQSGGWGVGLKICEPRMFCRVWLILCWWMGSQNHDYLEGLTADSKSQEIWMTKIRDLNLGFCGIHLPLTWMHTHTHTHRDIHRHIHTTLDHPHCSGQPIASPCGSWCHLPHRVWFVTACLTYPEAPPTSRNSASQPHIVIHTLNNCNTSVYKCENTCMTSLTNTHRVRGTAAACKAGRQSLCSGL